MAEFFLKLKRRNLALSEDFVTTLNFKADEDYIETFFVHFVYCFSRILISLNECNHGSMINHVYNAFVEIFIEYWVPNQNHQKCRFL